MKIIGIEGNYGAGSSVQGVYLMADSSLLKDGKPFFVPDFATRFVARPTVVAHVCRLGKNIAAKFASRYYDRFTVGLSVCAVEMNDQWPDGGVLSRAFDGAAILGDFVPLTDLPDTGNLDYEVTVDGAVRFAGNTAMLATGVDEIIEHVSRYMTLKIGDYIYLSSPSENIDLTIDTHIVATLAGREVLRMKVK